MRGCRRAARATSDLEAGRHELDRVVQRWAALDGPIPPAVASRFAQARRAVEDRLLGLELVATETRQADAQRAAALAPLVSLCEHVEQLDGPLARDHVVEARGALGGSDARRRGPDDRRPDRPGGAREAVRGRRGRMRTPARRVGGTARTGAPARIAHERHRHGGADRRPRPDQGRGGRRWTRRGPP